jgi:poly-gamma-glutamate capsule biosynthesis protein CapA/YwtB (metallophosphatase superfamily)
MFKALMLSLIIFQGPPEEINPNFQAYFYEYMEVDEPINLVFAGDTMMDWSIKETIKQQGPDFPFTEVKEQVSAADYAVVNLETAVAKKNEGKKYPKIYNFKSDPIALEGLKNAGFDLVTLANNHAMDYGESGLLKTIDYINQYKLAFVGAGVNAEQAYSAHTITVKGKEIAFLNFSHVLPSVTWYAELNKPGLASGYQLDRMILRVEEVKKQADYVFVTIHWGKEKTNKPVYYQKSYAKALIDAGADGIIGHHPHWLQGFEYYKNKPIAYSLGNFLFPNYVKGKTAETGLYTITIEKGEITTAFHPYLINNDKIVKLSSEQERKALNYLEQISFNLEIDGYQLIAK